MSFGSSTTSSHLFLLSILATSLESRRRGSPFFPASPPSPSHARLSARSDQISTSARSPDPLRPNYGIQIRRFPFRRLLPLRRRLFSSLRQSDPSISLSSASPSSSVPLLSCAAFRSVASLSSTSPSSSVALLSSMASRSAASPLVDVSLFVDYSSQWGHSSSSPSSISARVLLDPDLLDQFTAASSITIFLTMQILSLQQLARSDQPSPVSGDIRVAFP